MLPFFKKHSYDIVKMLINQLAISIFGNALALATGATQATLRIVTSIFSVLFYLFLIYVMMWDLGAKDTFRFQKGEKGLTRLAGIWMALLASIPNFLLAVLISLGTAVGALGSVGAVSKMIALFLEGMYTGLLAIPVNGIALHSIGGGFIFFLLPLPLIATAGIAYFAGSHDFKIFRVKR